MDHQTVLLTILGMALVTYLPRVLPILFLSSRTLPGWLGVWLRYVPAAVLAAMVMPTLVIHQGEIHIGPDNIYLLAAAPTLVIAWRTKSLWGAVATGIVLTAGIRYFGH